MLLLLVPVLKCFKTLFAFVVAAQDKSGVAFWSVWQDDEDWHLSSWNKNGIQIQDCLLPPSGGPWKIDRSSAAAGAFVVSAATRFRCVDFMAEHASQPSGGDRSATSEKAAKEPGARASKTSSVAKMETATPLQKQNKAKSGTMLPSSLAPPPKHPATAAPSNVRVTHPKRLLAERLRKQGMVWYGMMAFSLNSVPKLYDTT